MNFVVVGSIQVNNRQLFKVKICVTHLYGILLYSLPAKVFYKLRLHAICCEVALDFIPFEYKDGSTDLCLSHQSSSGICHLSHCLNLTGLERNVDHSCRLFNRLGRLSIIYIVAKPGMVQVCVYSQDLNYITSSKF